MARIVFIVDHLAGGGAEKISLQLADETARRGHTVFMAVMNREKDRLPIPETLNTIDLQLPESLAFGPLWKKRNFGVAKDAVQNLLDSTRPDLIVTGFKNGHWLAEFLPLEKTWHWVHGDLMDGIPLKGNLLKRLKTWSRIVRRRPRLPLLLRAKRVLVVNQNVADNLHAWLPNTRFVVLHNGVPLPATTDTSPLSTARHWSVVFVGRLTGIKQPEHAIQVF